MLADMPLSELRQYRGSQHEPADFHEFWANTLHENAHPLELSVRPVTSPLRTVEVFDITFSGYGGTPVHAWLRIPAQAPSSLPAVVQYVGYGGGRGNPAEDLLLASSGFAHLQMDTRGQGGDTSDLGPTGPSVPGVMTRGIRDPREYYYRRLIVDAVRAVSAAKELHVVDPDRVAVKGSSQGAGLALAVAGLREDVAAVAAFVPFLCDFPRAVNITDAYPYHEVVDYLARHRDETDQAHRTLSYFDSLNFVSRATAPAIFSAALMDFVCPPSTVFAAYNRYAGAKEIRVWEYNGHVSGVEDDLLAINHFNSTLNVNFASTVEATAMQ